jgi:hypothetical protein
VFATVTRLLGQNTEVKVTKTDASKRSVEFTDGKQIGRIQVNTLATT